jgi:hypothetical protein
MWEQFCFYLLDGGFRFITGDFGEKLHLFFLIELVCIFVESVWVAMNQVLIW